MQFHSDAGSSAPPAPSFNYPSFSLPFSPFRFYPQAFVSACILVGTVVPWVYYGNWIRPAKNSKNMESEVQSLIKSRGWEKPPVAQAETQ